jgi:hypothetical protein
VWSFFSPPHFSRFTFPFWSLSQPNFLSTQDPRYVPFHWLFFYNRISFYDFILFFYQVFDAQKEEAVAKIESLEAKVWELEEQLREGDKFDRALMLSLMVLEKVVLKLKGL